MRFLDIDLRICYTKPVPIVIFLKEVICMCINTKKKNKASLHAKPIACDGCME